MVWRCAQCGAEAATESVGMLVAMGWRITEPQRGVCPTCVRKEGDANLAGERARKHRRQRRDRTP